MGSCLIVFVYIQTQLNHIWLSNPFVVYLFLIDVIVPKPFLLLILSQQTWILDM